MRAPLLLHSMTEFREVIFGCLEIAGARSVVEIGAEEAAFTRELLTWTEAKGGTLHCVEPAPTPALREMSENAAALTLVEGRSPDALAELGPHDAYLIDGDHNYATVSGELNTIERQCREAGRPYLVFLHDVGWPCGRRDAYYDPESLPPGAVHPFSYDRGATLGTRWAVEGGFRGEGEFAFALEEGGPANGVLTAVEDFLDGRDLTFVTVPCIFGLGVLFPSSADYAGPLADFLAAYDENPLLERLEQNRLSLYLKVIELQDEQAPVHRQLEQANLRIRDVEAENRALWARTAELEAQVQALAGQLEHLRGEVRAVVASRAFALAERLSHLRGRLGRSEGPGLSRERLRDAVEGARTT